MRKILQSKTGVSCLVLLALLCIAGNFVRFPKSSAATVAARETAAPSEAAPEEIFQVPPSSRVAAELRAWRERLSLETARRDPFAAVLVAPPTAVTNPPVPPSFQLQAVSFAGGRVLAVVNQRVVAEGEWLEGCRVEKILPDEVRLVSPLFGPITARFDRTPNTTSCESAHKAPLENPPAAVLPPGPSATNAGGTAR
jgi:hypothetical protein